MDGCYSSNNRLPLKWHALSKIERVLGLNKKTLLNMLNNFDLDDAKKKDIFEKLNNPQFLFNIRKIYKFLSSYSGVELNVDFQKFYNTLSSDGLSSSFYIYFMYIYFNKREGITFKNEKFKHNISLLFYSEDVEVKFNKNKFREHFRKAYLGLDTLNKEVDETLVALIKSELPTTINNELDLAIAIYILLCKKFCYSPKYIISGNKKDVLKYWEVNCDNNEIVCYNFSIIYYKLLKMYGIDANLAGDYFSHMKVNLRIDSMMLEADATNFGFSYTNEYKISDIANVKYGLALTGFKLAQLSYSDEEYIKYNQKRLDESMMNLTGQLYDKKDNAFNIATFLYESSLKLRELKKSESFNLEDEIDFQIDVLNRLLLFKVSGSECENKQFLAKFSHKLFSSYSKDNIKVILLYQKEDNVIHLYNLYMIKIGEKILYYLETSEGFIKYDLASLKEEILKRNLKFKDSFDFDLLNKSDETKQKVKKKELKKEDS